MVKNIYAQIIHCCNESTYNPRRATTSIDSFCLYNNSCELVQVKCPRSTNRQPPPLSGRASNAPNKDKNQISSACIIVRIIKQNTLNEDKLIKFLNLKTGESVSTVTEFRVWQADVVSRLQPHFNYKDNALFSQFAQIPCEVSPEGSDIVAAFGGFGASNVFNTDGLGEAKLILASLRRMIRDDGLPGEKELPPEQRKKEAGQTTPTNVINIQQTQQQNINMYVMDALRKTLSDDQLKNLEQILKTQDRPTKLKSLSGFLKGVGESSLAKILATIIVGN